MHAFLKLFSKNVLNINTPRHSTVGYLEFKVQIVSLFPLEHHCDENHIVIARAERSDNGIAKWIATFIPLHQTAEEVFSRQFHRATLAIVSLLKLFYIINCCRLFTSLDHYRTRGKEFVRLYKVLFDLSCKL